MFGNKDNFCMKHRTCADDSSFSRSVFLVSSSSLCVSCASQACKKRHICHNNNRMCVISKQTVLETRTLFVPKNRTFVSSFPSTDFFSLSFPVFIIFSPFLLLFSLFFSLPYLICLEHTTESMAKTQNVSYKDAAKLGC